MLAIVRTTLLLLLPLFAAAQPVRIDTDRPDQTESAFLVPTRWLQFEMGFNDQSGGRRLPNEYLLPTLLSKFGVNRHLELRLITTVQSQQFARNAKSRYWETGLQPIEVGAKVHIAEARGLLPQTALIFHFALPRMASPNKRMQKLAPNFRFTMQNSLTDNLALGYNLGAEWDGFSNTPVWIYTFAPGFNMGKRWYGYVEAFGAVSKQASPQHSVDGGIAWYATHDLKIDFSGGRALNGYAPRWYLALGASARLCTVQKSR